jgi:predicted MFS family arabinose efflux permease
LETESKLPRSFYIVSLASFLFQLTRFTLQPIFTLYILELGATLVQAGFILSIQNFLMIITRIPLTMLSKKIGETRMFVIAFLVQTTAPILYGLVPNPNWLYLIPFYEVLAIGSFNQMAMSTASDMAPPTRQGDALGRYMTFMSSGMFIGPLITSALLIYLGYKQLFFFTALFPLTALILFIRYMPKASKIEVEIKEGSSTWTSLKAILRERSVLILTLIRTTYSLANTMFTAFFAVYATQSLGFTESIAALLFSIMGFTNALVKVPAGLLSDRIGSKKVLMTAFTALILVFISISYATSLLVLALSLVVFGLCWGSRAVTEWAHLASTVHPENKSIAMSYLSSIWGLGATVGSILAGVFAESLPFSTIFLIGAAINLPALPAIYLLPEVKTVSVLETKGRTD